MVVRPTQVSKAGSRPQHIARPPPKCTPKRISRIGAKTQRRKDTKLHFVMHMDRSCPWPVTGNPLHKMLCIRSAFVTLLFFSGLLGFGANISLKDYASRSYKLLVVFALSCLLDPRPDPRRTRSVNYGRVLMSTAEGVLRCKDAASGLALGVTRQDRSFRNKGRSCPCVYVLA